MSERDVEIGQRVSAAREARSMTQAAVAELLGVGPTVVSKIEKGTRRLDGFELAVLAEHLGTTSRSLLGLSHRTSALTAAARIGAGATEPALVRARELLELDGLADELGLDGRANPRRLGSSGVSSLHDAARLANEVRDSTGLGDAGIVDVISFAEQAFGVDVAVEPLGESGASGLLVQFASEVALAVLNGDDHVSRRRFTLAHELGHWLMGDPEPVIIEAEIGSNSDVERRADVFAVELLLPEAGVRRIVDRALDDVAAVVDGLVTFGVSREAFVNRVRGLGLFDAHRAAVAKHDPVRTLFVRAGRLSDYAIWSQDDSVRRIPARIERRLIGAYAAGRIGIGVLAQAFNTKPADLADQLASDGLAPVSEPDNSAFEVI